jgi:uncharacterized protein
MLAKLLVLAAILLAVWYGARWIARVDKARRRWEQVRREQQAEAVQQAKRDAAGITETERCVRCGVYMTAGTGHFCGREDCPYR